MDRAATHLWMEKKICLPPLESSTADRLFRVGQMTVQDLFRQCQRPVVQEFADQRELLLKCMVRRSDGSTVLLLEGCMSCQVPSRNKNLAGSTAKEGRHRARRKADDGVRELTNVGGCHWLSTALNSNIPTSAHPLMQIRPTVCLTTGRFYARRI